MCRRWNHARDANGQNVLHGSSRGLCQFLNYPVVELFFLSFTKLLLRYRKKKSHIYEYPEDLAVFEKRRVKCRVQEILRLIPLSRWDARSVLLSISRALYNQSLVGISTRDTTLYPRWPIVNILSFTQGTPPCGSSYTHGVSARPVPSAFCTRFREQIPQCANSDILEKLWTNWL